MGRSNKDEREADQLFDNNSVGGKLVNERKRRQSALDDVMEQGGMKDDAEKAPAEKPKKKKFLGMF